MAAHKRTVDASQGVALYPLMGTAADLLRKAKHDRERMREEPWDPYVAIDFFVTAEHLGDWSREGEEGRVYRHGTKPSPHGGTGCLLVACHLAIGAKHFDVSQANKPVTSVADEQGAFERTGFGPGFERGGLTVTHEAAGGLLARTVRAEVLADEVLTFWAGLISTPA